MTPSTRPSIFRRKYIIRARFQWEVICFAVLTVAITLGTFYLGVQLALQPLMEQCRLDAVTPDAPCGLMLTSFRRALLLLFVLNLLVGLGFIGIGTMLLSHRVAGPLYRLTVAMKSIARGEPGQPIAFRKKDYFSDVATAFNELIRSRGL